MYWADLYDGVPVLGTINTVYQQTGGSGGRFGFPTAPEELVEDQPGMRMQQFEGGVICVVQER